MNTEKIYLISFLMVVSGGTCFSEDGLRYSAITDDHGVVITIRNVSNEALEYRDVDGRFRESIYVLIGKSRLEYMDRASFAAVTKGFYRPRKIPVPAGGEVIYRIAYDEMELLTTKQVEGAVEYKAWSDLGNYEIGLGYVAGPVSDSGTIPLWGMEVISKQEVAVKYPWKKERK